MGVWSGPFNNSHYVGQDAYGWGLVTNGTQLASLHNGTAVNYGGSPFSNNDIIGLALNADTGSLQFFRNNASIGTVTVSTGTIYPAVGSGGFAVTCIANFGASTFAYAPPAGYNAGIY